MAVAFATDPPSFSSDNLLTFLQGQPDACLTYSIEGRAGHIDGIRYHIFDRIFKDHTREWDCIEEDAAAEFVRLSKLPEDALEELWEAVSFASP